jgi:hypothetical protein
MNNESLSIAMIIVFGITTLLSLFTHLAFKDINKRRGNSEKEDEGAGGLYLSLLGFVAGIGFYISAKSDNNSIIERFNKGEDIYCYSSSFDSKWEKVNKSDGWYLEEDILKHREQGLKISIHRCKESF